MPPEKRAAHDRWQDRLVDARFSATEATRLVRLARAGMDELEAIEFLVRLRLPRNIAIVQFGGGEPNDGRVWLP